MPSMWGHRFQSPLLQTVSARDDKSTPRFPISTSENGQLNTIEATSRLHRRCSGTMSAAEARPHKYRHHRQHHHARVLRCSSRSRRSGSSAASQSRFNVALPLILPGRVLPGNGEVRDIFPHLDEAQLD